MSYRLGVDIGGTFTDITLLDADGSYYTHKTPSTPSAPEKAVFDGIVAAVTRFNKVPSDCEAMVHSSTIALNAVVQRSGAKLGLLVTQEFEDLLELGRVKMSDPFSLSTTRIPPLVRKDFVRGIPERTAADGTVLKLVDEQSVVKAAKALLDRGAESLAILFLHSFRNPANERAAKRVLAERFPSLDVWVSHEVWPQIREYERATITVMNAFIAPRMRSYISVLSREKETAGITAPLYISGSNGGVMPASRALATPISTLLSGPSAGVVAASHLMKTTGLEQVITLDIGGTSADICILGRSEIPYHTGQEIEGMPISVPYVDVSSIGAGGGSIARADALGVLRVGPQSAGSVPGPACYGRGGEHPTVTDAYLLNGYIDPDRFAGGELRLDRERSHAAIATLASLLRLGVHQTADGVLRVTTSNLVAELTRLCAQHGVDARDYTLMAFGGAGATHACLLADELRIKQIVVPESPGTFCALGSVLADFRMDYLKTEFRPLSALRQQEVHSWYETVTKEGVAALGEVASDDATTLFRSADVRYTGQGFEVTLGFESLDDIPARFRAEYQRKYGTRQEDAPIEVINLRGTIVAGIRKPVKLRQRSRPRPHVSHRTRAVYLGEWLELPAFDREALHDGWSAAGPLIIDQPDTTCLVTSGWNAEIDETGSLNLRK